MGQQVSYWGEMLCYFVEVQVVVLCGMLIVLFDDGFSDLWFKNLLWQLYLFFNFIKWQYQINVDVMCKVVSDLDIGSMIDCCCVEWFMCQMIDMMVLMNFLVINLDVLEKVLVIEGESLVKGFENLVCDIEQYGGEMLVLLVDCDVFCVGELIGIVEGRVVVCIKLYELIQYLLMIDQVYEILLVIFLLWINKFYIMDLKLQNSLICWIVDQGYMLFVVVWKNFDISYGQIGMEDYVLVYFEVMDWVQDIIGQEKLNVVGYCIVGIILVLMLLLLKQCGDDWVNLVIFFIILMDFLDQGEFIVFL